MNGLLKEKVKASGYKYVFLASYLGITPQYFSMVMRDERDLSLPKEDKLREFLKDVMLPLSTTA